MATSCGKLISKYCTAHGIAIPPGFGRNTPCRYAIIRSHLAPPKLVATTWFKVSDVLYFVHHHLAPELGAELSASIQILDFKEADVLVYDGSDQLKRVGTFSLG